MVKKKEVEMDNMPNPSGFIDLIKTYSSHLWLIFLACLGGTASYVSRINKHKLGFSFVEWVGEMTISGFAGIVTMYLCVAQGYDFAFTAAATGIAGHMGGRAIGILENWAQAKSEKIIKIIKE